MNTYETVMILKNDIIKEKKEAILEKITKYISENGEIIETKDLGERKLAYEVNSYKNGYYFIIKFKSESRNISELERLYRITDEIIKFIVVKEN
ncbi:MAG: 30S ribosomal protein S6 [Clostridia bacterium]|nr:30S ribosomal protein S6 [Clostridia bacterium]